MSDLLNCSPRRTELGQDGVHCHTDGTDQSCRKTRGGQMKTGSSSSSWVENKQAGEGVQPFFCRNREDSPRPVIGKVTFSPIQEVCARRTNEVL